MISIYPFQTPAVRDLAWACFSPSLLLTRELDGYQQMAGNCSLELTTARQAWLRRLDRDASSLLEHLSRQRSHRLGVYFEHLWHFFLIQDPAVDLVAHNLPIRYRGRTLGEFDCIYFCHQRRHHVHLELAVKFFLGYRQTTTTEPASHWHEWLGTDTADRLDLKVQHLLQRQIRLGEDPVARARLLELDIEELDREVEVKGYLFQSLSDPLVAPMGFNPAQQLQTWLSIVQLEQYLKDRDDARYLLLPKQHWLCAAHIDRSQQGLAAGELSSRLSLQMNGDRRPQLVAALDDSGREVHRFFVTGPGWPCPQTPDSPQLSPGR